MARQIRFLAENGGAKSTGEIFDPIMNGHFVGLQTTFFCEVRPALGTKEFV